MDALAIKQKVRDDGESELINQLRGGIREIDDFTGRVYFFTSEQAEYFGRKFEEIVDSKDTQQLDKTREDVFRTVSNKGKKAWLYKVMVHYATVNREEELSIEAIDYALKAVEMHLDSFLSLLISLNPAKSVITEERKKMELKKEECKQKIFQTLTEKGAFTRSEFYAKLKQEYGISLGEQSCDKIFQGLIDEKKSF